MFPTDKVSTMNVSEDTEAGKKRSFYFDFDLQKFVVRDGKVNEVVNKQAIIQWVTTFLHTILNHYRIYDGYDFGISIDSYIGLKKSNIGLIRSELERQLSENITINPAITGIKNFDCNYYEGKLKVCFTVILKDEEVEVGTDVTFS